MFGIISGEHEPMSPLKESEMATPKHSNHESSIAHMMSSVMRESKQSSYVNFVERKKLHNPMR